MDKRVMGGGKDDPADDPSFMKVVRHFLRTPKPEAKEEPKSSRPNDKATEGDHKSVSKKKIDSE